ncbi:hypothetical protein [Natronorubrum halophilum]|uniref:hypothetical protein n=1 Tax=Natronorubrum halophilum TaxID=1702106 RepID=UPI0010C1EC98|nr:hypothetical protein [Natronorubrum halophilum]
MTKLSRRKLLVTGTTGLIVGGAGCLNGDSASNESEPDDSGNQNGDRESLAPLARWIPTTAGSRLFFLYTDLETVRTHEAELPAETVDDISFAPHGAGGRVVGRMETEPTFEYVLEFGPSGDGGHYVMGGEFDLAGLDLGDPVEMVGEFEHFEGARASIAASSDTLVVVDPDIGDIDDVLAAGLDGTDRRVDSNGSFGTVLEHVGDGTLAFGIAPESADETAVGQSWSVAAETATYTRVMLGIDTSGVDDDQLKSQLADTSPFDRLDEFSLDIESDTVAATGTLSTSDFRYTDSISKRQAGTSKPVHANVSVDIETATQSVTVELTSIGAGHVEVRDSGGTRATLTQQGEEATLEYEVGESETVLVVVVGGDAESVLLSEPVEF